MDHDGRFFSWLTLLQRHNPLPVRMHLRTLKLAVTHFLLLKQVWRCEYDGRVSKYYILR
jgi:hypothetical protein